MIEERKRQFEEISLNNMDALYSQAIRLTKSASAAESLIQETYLLASRIFGCVDDGIDSRAWFCGLLRKVFTKFQLKRETNDVLLLS